jgi:DNA-binding GntR family transcriptional regulator
LKKESVFVSGSVQSKKPDFGVLKSVPEKRSLGQHVYENLKEAILKGDLTPGSRMIESRVADVLGTSRTPVREAIHKLEREGLLRKHPNGGFSVSGLTRKDIEETFGIRSVLESYAARLAALKHREDDVLPLEGKIKEFQNCLEVGLTEDLPRINTEFHDLLYGLSRSTKLIKMINDLRDQIFRFRHVILKVEKMAKRSNDDHKLMLEFIKNRDPDGVERIVREHILRGQEVVLNELNLLPEEEF